MSFQNWTPDSTLQPDSSLFKREALLPDVESCSTRVIDEYARRIVTGGRSVQAEKINGSAEIRSSRHKN